MTTISSGHYSQSSVATVDRASAHPLMSWRSVLAGLIVSFVAMAALTGLGMAFGGIGLDESTTARGAGTFAGIWFLVSSLLSVLVGSYFAARVSRFPAGRVGAAQGVIIASLFFGFFLYQTVSAIGWAGKAAGSVVSGTASAAVQGAASASQSSAINEVVEDSLANANIAPEKVQAVATGVASRLLRGEPDSARNYLARQTGVTQAEAQATIDNLKVQVAQAAEKVREGTAVALKATGWTVFLSLVLGLIAAALGGALGSRVNLRKPMGLAGEVAHGGTDYATI